MIRRNALVERLEPRQLLSASMVKDLNTTPGQLPGLWASVGAGDTVFLSQEDGVAGWELYKTDGTPGGTVLVKDIRPGRDNSAPGWLTHAGGGTIFFTADDGEHGVELWKSDGTAAGTALVKDINPGAGTSGVSNLVNVNGTIYFSASDPVNGNELWKSDGTEAGTVVVKNIAGGSTGSSPSQLINNNGVVFFRANNGTSGFELWKSDGSDAGTVQVAELFAGSSSGMANTAMAAVGGFVYFAGITSAGGTDVWRADGSGPGTTMVKALGSGATPANFRSSGSRAYFTVSAASDLGLWSTDGSPAVNVIAATTQNWTDVNGTLFFGSGTTLYSTTGGAPTTLRTGLTMATNVGPWANAGGTLFFTANDGSGTGDELWKSNGTPGGTGIVKDIEPGATGSAPFIITPFGPGGTSVVFSTFTSAPVAGGIGGAIYRSDGTEPNTVLVKDINPATADSSPLIITPFKNWVYFIASEPTYSNGTIGELYRSDGTEAGTGIAVDLNPGPAGATASSLKVMGDWLYFAGNDGSGIGKELWRTDGTATQLVKNINPGASSSSPGTGVVSGNYLYFWATTDAAGEELWRTDGTDAGTLPLTANPAGSSINLMADVGGWLYFTVHNSSNAFAGLFRTDGGVTLPVTTTFTGVSSMLNVGGTLFLAASTGGSNTLWKIAPGTTTPTQITSPATLGNAPNFTNVGGRLFYAATAGSNGTELWMSDGTTAAMVEDINPGSSSSSPTNIVAANGLAYFRATHNVSGSELWRSDGTADGTYMVKDITPAGATNGSPGRLFAANGFVYFAANDYNAITPDAWRSDGTPEGTAPISRFPRGAFLNFPSNASFHAAMGGDVYYFFTDDTHGAELWKSEQPDFAAPGAGGALAISGTGGDDVIDLSTDGSGNLLVTLNGLTESFAPGAVTSVTVAGHAGGDTVNVNAGAVAFAGDSGAATASLTLRVAAGASATFNNSQTLATLILDGGDASVAPGGDKALALGALYVSGDAALNLNDNALVVRDVDGGGTTLPAVRAMITTGHHGGDWLGTGLTSATAAADASRATALGYATAGQLGVTSFLGVTGLTATDVVVRHTYYGDTNLDRLVNTDDVINILAAGKLDAGSPADWFEGDFTFDNLANTDDIIQLLATGRLDQP